MPSTALDFKAYPVGSRHVIKGAVVVVCGTAIVAFVPDATTAERITDLLNEHGLADTDDLEAT
jgi:hypothetical protein